MNTEEIHDGHKNGENKGRDGTPEDKEARGEPSGHRWGPRYHCQDCGRDFGSTPLRPGVLTDAERYRQATRKIIFETGGLMQGFLTVRLEKMDEGSFMQVSPGFTPDRKSGEIQSGQVSITAEQWDAVVGELYEDLFVLDWKEAYENPYVMDGQRWSLDLTMKDGETLHYHGMNAYPVYWAEVLRLFDPLSVIGIDDAKGKEGESDWVMANRTDKGKWTLDRETHRFEKPERLAELDPVGTLRRFGLRDGDSVCDIGAGTGVFTFPAAALTRNNVYAVDINDEMLAAINEKIRKERTRNVIAMKGDGETLDFEDGSIDLALMVTVFHHIGDKPGMLREIRRVLTGDGRFGIIEFHDRVTPSGPPVGNRIGKMEVLGFLEEAGFEEVEGFDLGENFYAKVFRVKDSTSAHD
jgi:SAM-dependent methyltransferase